MMQVTLDNILNAHHDDSSIIPSKKSSTWKNIQIFLAVFVTVTVFVFVFTNATLIGQTLGLQESIHVQEVQANQQLALQQDFQHRFSQETLAAIPTMTQQRKITQSTNDILAQETDNHDFSFSLLPPVDRLVIPTIGLDVPLVSNTHKDHGDFIDGDFDSELRNGVVKYPTTPFPGRQGNTMIFGHTSQERWEKNPYGTVFSNLPKLQAGDEIQVVQDGELYTYRVLETVVKRPRDVESEFQKRQAIDKDILTLMGCYPLGTTKQRMMVMAEKIE